MTMHQTKHAVERRISGALIVSVSVLSALATTVAPSDKMDLYQRLDVILLSAATMLAILHVTRIPFLTESIWEWIGVLLLLLQHQVHFARTGGHVVLMLVYMEEAHRFRKHNTLGLYALIAMAGFLLFHSGNDEEANFWMNVPKLSWPVM